MPWPPLGLDSRRPLFGTPLSETNEKEGIDRGSLHLMGLREGPRLQPDSDVDGSDTLLAI